MKKKYKVSNKGAEISSLEFDKMIKISRRKNGLTDTKEFTDKELANECFEDLVND